MRHGSGYEVNTLNASSTRPGMKIADLMISFPPLGRTYLVFFRMILVKPVACCARDRTSKACSHASPYLVPAVPMPVMVTA